ncbi:taste receptor type 1 member 1-like isoform X2 [Alosa alosa]|uniref:taste receptor type 1 member 1-like isoform X2 n=1 Tax=Alosa alosa TaxID=278164 RepID=UPI0020151E0F|nr:taste receptor type 1 member 1-like isoform X2 [Alosa alosa]
MGGTETMQLAFLTIFVICLHNACFWECSCQASDFNLDGDYLIGGLFPVHYAEHSGQQRRPVAIKCDEKSFFLTGYHLLQVMRFAVEEINNLTSLLPNVSLGYQLFDHCSSTYNFPSSLQFFSSHNDSIKVREDYNRYLPKVIGFTGPLSSSESVSLAPLFMMDLIPMISYGASSSIFSDKKLYPSFLRTVPSNKDQIELIIQIIKHFGWNWVAFIGTTSTYSQDGFQLFYDLVENLKAAEVIHLAIQHKFQNKVWIAGEAWSMYQPLTKQQGIETIGTIIGVTPHVAKLPGFSNFIHQSRMGGNCKSCHSGAGLSDEAVCNQDCEACSSQSAEDIINEGNAYSFSVYSAVYVMAMALHNALQCNHSGCDTSRTVYPYMLLREMKRLPMFSLNQLNVYFDENGDPPAHYSVVFWNTADHTVKIQPIGTYDNQQVLNLSIDDMQIHWHGDGLVPFSNCSAECKPGHVRQQEGQHQCCFTCVECPINQYTNHTADLYSCLKCDQYDWSEAGSTSCQKRSVEFLHFSDVIPILILLSASSLMLLCLGVAVLFAIHYSTPVVRSAGGSMCFLMLGCLAASSISIFFYFGEPSALSCLLRSTPLTFFYTVCLSCLLVRSVSIICIFKMASHLPKAYALWVKYSGHWLLVAGVSFFQLILCVIAITVSPPMPINDMQSFKDQVVLRCIEKALIPVGFGLGLMCSVSGVCFLLSYMGKDLPKNYNEAKAITFCLLVSFLSWAAYLEAYMLSRSKYVQLIKAIVELSCLYGIMFSYFIPKSFIIVFQPQKNTQEYFQASIQSYTQTISRM